MCESYNTVANKKFTSEFIFFFDFVQSTAQIGIQKLYLLSSLSEEERTEIVENTDLENTSVKELKAKLAELQEKNKTLEEDFVQSTEPNRS